MIQMIRKPGKELGSDELEVINAGRRKEFGSEDKLEPQPGNVNWEAVFFLLKDEGERILAFGKLHQIKVVFAGETHSVYCFSTLVSLDKGKGLWQTDIESHRNLFGDSGENSPWFL